MRPAIITSRRSCLFVFLIALSVACAKSGTQQKPLTEEEQYQLILQEITKLLQNGHQRFSQAVVSLGAIDTMTVPGSQWPYAFPRLSKTNLFVDSQSVIVGAFQGDPSVEYWQSVGQFIIRDSNALYPRDLMAYALNHSHGVRGANGFQLWSDRFSASLEWAATRDTVRVSYALSAEFRQNDVCPVVGCERFRSQFIARILNDDIHQLRSPVLFPASASGEIAYYAGPDSTGYPSAKIWKYRATVYADWLAVLETTLGSFQAIDTVVFSPFPL